MNQENNKTWKVIMNQTRQKKKKKPNTKLQITEVYFFGCRGIG
jgi:hypothetical protein